MEILDRRFQTTPIIVRFRLSGKERMPILDREALLIFSWKSP
jgi:hypothetical protein